MTSSITRLITASSVTAAFTLALAVPGPALAQRAPAAHLSGMQHRQETEIRQGIKSGALNKQQAARLVKGEKTIQKTEERDKAKGPMTEAEANQLKRDNQRENAAIKQAVGAGNDGYAKPPSH